MNKKYEYSLLSNFKFVILKIYLFDMKRVVIVIVLSLLIIQLIRPEKNSSTINELELSDFPLEITNILQQSCLDCHSNSTNYPWYSNIAPISWIIANHVNEGKEHLNFSAWENYNKNQKEHMLDELEHVVKLNKMPLKSYLLMHDVALSELEKKFLLEWVATTKENLK